MKTLLLSTALLGATAFAAQAQDTFLPGNDPLELRASDLIGMRLYATEAALDADEYEGAQDGWDDLGEINDLLVSRDGAVQAVLVDVGGFLGIGERQVAVSMEALQFVSDSATADDADDFFLVLNAPRSALEAAPEYGAAATAADDAAATADATDAAMTDEAAGATTAEAASDEAVTDEAVANAAATGAAESAAAAEQSAEAAQASADAATETEMEADETAAAAAGDTATTDTATTDTAATGQAATAGTEMADTAAGDAATGDTATEDMAAADATAGEAATDEAATDEMAAADPATGEAATETATDEAMADGAAADRTPVTREGYLAAEADYLTAEKLAGAAVYDANDERVGEVADIVLSDAGQVTDVVIDVGGFLGIGEKPVAMQMGDLDILRQEAGEEVRVYVTQSREALEAMPTYEN